MEIKQACLADFKKKNDAKAQIVLNPVMSVRFRTKASSA